ncbi:MULTISPECIES: RHS repeat-associated core domain-containing protein [Pseudomonas]|jgi:RHS repeat-associated protein|uniref:Teneurin-like YD-shell domain-containing protein n=1 Tax=Pseudomonas fluorescens TaxID=294 RepID=A0A5E7SAI9_PSEFL|nr:RHS repeat-associated core domain-containing protein [Pseudomonas fluorescens]VVP82928.1 hypothetical protein PS928_00903 [Pseudomonas fluorescens]
MQIDREALLCRYQYDPLDRLVDYTQSAKANTRRFYLKDRLVTEIQDEIQRSIMQHEDQLLAQQQRQTGTLEVSLLATDQQRSVLSVPDASGPRPIAHTPYGHRPLASGLLSLLGFNGEQPDPVTGCYLLGNGYRAFNPVLMRFNSPDSWSPFGMGGLNAYAYCGGEPILRRDSTGHFSFFPKGYNPFKGLRNMLRSKVSSPPKATSVARSPISPTNKMALNLGSEHELVGYHGTSAEHARKMQVTGLDSRYIGTGSGTFYGDGFYATTDIHKALQYANVRSGAFNSSNTEGLLGVYVKKPSEKILNTHYKFFPESRELLIDPSIYRDVRVAPVELSSYSPQPIIEDIFNIRSGRPSTATSHYKY